jgi:hypothetical protein
MIVQAEDVASTRPRLWFSQYFTILKHVAINLSSKGQKLTKFLKCLVLLKKIQENWHAIQSGLFFFQMAILLEMTITLEIVKQVLIKL